MEPILKYFEALVEHPKFRDGAWAMRAEDGGATVQVCGLFSFGLWRPRRYLHAAADSSSWHEGLGHSA